MGLKMNDEIELEETVEINEIVDEEEIEEEVRNEVIYLHQQVQLCQLLT